MRTRRVLAAAAVAAAVAVPAAPASAAGVCTIWWRTVTTVGPVTVAYPYCIW